MTFRGGRDLPAGGSDRSPREVCLSVEFGRRRLPRSGLAAHGLDLHELPAELGDPLLNDLGDLSRAVAEVALRKGGGPRLRAREVRIASSDRPVLAAIGPWPGPRPARPTPGHAYLRPQSV
jgi:hypothetical protein